MKVIPNSATANNANRAIHYRAGAGKTTNAPGPKAPPTVKTRQGAIGLKQEGPRSQAQSRNKC